MKTTCSFALAMACACHAPASHTSHTETLPALTRSADASSSRRVLPDFSVAIRELATLDEAGIGFSPFFSGEQFLPVPANNEEGMFLLGQSPPKRSATLSRLVAAGASAVPALLACLDDATPTKLPPMKAMMWSAADDEYDFNRRTRTPPPGVNRTGLSAPGAPSSHAVSVGDLCFVALGQIVNRNFAAVRYQPTGGLMINSPPDSALLRTTARAEWTGLDDAKLEASLARDFTEPDDDARRIGATIRMHYYFPQALAPLLQAEVARPTFDAQRVHELVRQLYGLAPAARAKAFADFVAAGPAARDGVLRALFSDLQGQEDYEQKRVSPPTAGSDYRARECLIALFAYPNGVTAKDAPYPKYANDYEREALVKAAR